MSQFVNWIKSPQGRAYFFSTHFWGPVANWGLPLAALADMQKDESLISGVMSPTMAGYSSIFMAFAWQVQPRNYLLFACHATNATAQMIQTGRFVNYWYLGGKESRPAQITEAESTVLSAVKDAEAKAASALDGAREHAKEGGKDAVRRGKEIAEEAKRELAVAKDFISNKASTAESQASHAAQAAESQASQAASTASSKGWAFWRSTKSTAAAEAQQLEKEAEQAKHATAVDLEKAKAHVQAGGEDALRRGKEIVGEVKREAGEAKEYLPKVEVEKAKKGWFS